MSNSRVVVLGSNGMLGQQVSREFSLHYPGEVLRVARSGDADLHFEFNGQKSEKIVNDIGLNREDWVINCVGWIPQKSVSAEEDGSRANLLNIDLPRKLNQVSESWGIRVLQVGTDCVFDGLDGNYSEESLKTATDLYGQSKILGEIEQSGAMIVRSSIIGMDLNSTSGLFSWFLSQTSSDLVSGYIDHFWNGVTTSALAKIFRGIVEQEAFRKGVWHLVPADTVSKFELLTMFRELLGAPVRVDPIRSPRGPRNRTLSTVDPEFSSSLWGLGGYVRIPTIFDLVSEMIMEYRQRPATNGD